MQAALVPSHDASQELGVRRNPRTARTDQRTPFRREPSITRLHPRRRPIRLHPLAPRSCCSQSLGWARQETPRQDQQGQRHRPPIQDENRRQPHRPTQDERLQNIAFDNLNKERCAYDQKRVGSAGMRECNETSNGACDDGAYEWNEGADKRQDHVRQNQRDAQENQSEPFFEGVGRAPLARGRASIYRASPMHCRRSAELASFAVSRSASRIAGTRRDRRAA